MTCICIVLLTLAVFLLVFIFSYGKRASYHTKMFTFFLGSAIAVILWMPFMLFRPRNYKNGLVPGIICRFFGRLIGVSMEVRGIKNVDVNHGSVVIMNHQSALDLLVLSHLWPIIGNATVVSKREVLYIPFFGFGAWLWGTLFINRSKKSSINHLNKETEAINKRKCKILVFPEGTRNDTDNLLPFKKGAFHIAARSGCPLQPVVISKYHFLKSSEKKFTKGHVIINILPEIFIASTDNVEDVINKCRNIMQSDFENLSNETSRMHIKEN